MAHKVGRKLKKLSLKNIGTGKNLDVFKGMNFGDYATMLGAGLGGAGMMGFGSGMPGIGGMMGKLNTIRKGIGGGLGRLGEWGMGKLGMGGAEAGAEVGKGLFSKFGGWDTAKGLLGMGLAGGMGNQPMQQYPDFTSGDEYKQLQGDVDWMRGIRDNMMNPESDYNRQQLGQAKDVIGFGNTMGARNAASMGMSPNSGITMQNANTNLNRGVDQFYGNIEKRMPNAFNMGQSLIQPQRGMFEDIENRNISNIQMGNQENAMNNMYRQQAGYGLLNNWVS